MSRSQNPYVFVVGCPRSGTTLLGRMLGAHPDLAIVNETHWLARWYEKRKGLTPEGLVTPEHLDALLAHRKFRKHFALEKAELERLAKDSRAYPELMSSLFDGFASVQGKRLAGDKDPGSVKYMATLHDLWPAARFVHIIRDGRDVALSATSWKRKAPKLARRYPTWRSDPVGTAALWWEYHVRLGREWANGSIRHLYREVRYEALVGQPEAEMRKLCEFLDLQYDPSMLRFHDGRRKDDPGLDAKHAWLPATKGLRDWRTQMSREDVELFEAVAGDLLEELGHARGAPSPSAALVERAGRLRRAFGTNEDSRVFRLPQIWG